VTDSLYIIPEVPEPVAPRRGLARDISLSTVGSFAGKLLGAAGGVVTARLLGPAGKGDYALFALLGAAVGTAATMGFQFWIAREVARPDGLDVPRASSVVRLQSGLEADAIAALLLVIGGPLVALDVVSAAEAFAVAALAWASVVSVLALAVPNGQRRMGVVAWAFGAGGALYLGTACALLAADRASVAAVLFIAAVGNLATALVALPRVLRPGTRVALPQGWYRDAMRLGVPGALGELVLLATFRIDLLIIAAFGNATEVGLYAVASSLAELLWLVPDGAAAVVLPHVAEEPGQAQTARLVRVSMTATLLAGIVLTVISGPVIDIVFGDDFADARAAVPWLALAAVALGAWKMIAADLVARGNSRVRATSAVAGLCVMVAADLALVPAFGIAGAGAGSAIGYIVAVAVTARTWSHMVERPARELFLMRRADLRRGSAS
jgi:O-antigen/teichoic acid export membrane protein